MGTLASETALWGKYGDQKRKHAGDFVREDRISTRSRPDDRQFSYWRDQVAFVADVTPADEAQVDKGYFADARGFDLGKMAVSSIRADAFGFNRNAQHIRRSGMDHWILSYRTGGGPVSSKSGSGKLRVEPQSLSLTSLAYPFEGKASSGSWISLYIEREHLLPIADRLDGLNHAVMHGITARIAIEFLTSMTRLLPVTPIAEIPIFVETALIVMKGFAEQSDLANHNSSRPILAVRLEMVKRFIQENLNSSNLEPDYICAAMKLSRRQLYYLFEQIGGVSTYIRVRRLIATHDAITDLAEDRPIHTVAASFGFHDAALFSRQFKAQFGYSPKEAREANMLGYAPLSTPPKSIEDWLGQVREPK